MKEICFKGRFCAKENVVIKKISLNLLQGLQRLSFPKCLCHNGMRGRCRNKSGNDTYIITTHGFTLIELLVVVLIIGILAAVALPQYQIAVEKARATQMLPMMRHIYEALALYKLQNGSYEISEGEIPGWDELGIEPPAGFECEGTDCYNGQWYCFPNEEHTGDVSCTNEKYAYMLEMFQPDESIYPEFAGKRVCISGTDFGKRVCKALGGTELEEKLGSMSAFEF